MCGFGGILNSKTILGVEQIREVALKVAFRGPDHTGLRIYDSELKQRSSGRNGLFFNRLAIIDLDERSNQPFEDERYTLLFNGEIYNFQEIKEVLESKGVRFNTASDTEVLFQSLIEWGVEAVRKINGMFAFFFLDRKTKQFILARDKVGIKPLYFKQEDTSFVFASEADSILRLAHGKSKICTDSVKRFLMLQYIPTPYSIYEDVKKLPPGHVIEGGFDQLANAEKLVPSVYWDAYDVAEQKIDLPGVAFEDLLIESVSSQLQSDVPIGFFLSSGIDSSLIAAVVNKHFCTGEKFRFFTISFQNASDWDESSHAKAFIEGFRNPMLMHQKLPLSHDSVASELFQIYKFTDEPFGDSALLLNYAISREAKKHVTVVLSGDGADELFWGYPRYNQWIEKVRMEKVNKLFYPFHLLFPPSSLKSRWQRRFLSDRVDMYLSMLSMGSLESLDLLKRDDLWWRQSLSIFRQRKDLPSLIDLKTYLPDCMLYKIDRSSMGASLEVRVPYLDGKVVEHALSLPLSEKLGSGGGKLPLRKTLLKLAPHYNFTLPKRGFNFPLALWLRKYWKSYLYDLITENTLNSLGLESNVGKKMLHEFYAHGNDRYACELWYLFNLALWYQEKKALL